MIKLITGIPGSGKTASVVADLLQIKDRPIFVDGIPDLTIEHTPCPPLSEWTEERPDPSSASGKKICFTFPPNSIIVIDECQRIYRPRSAASKVPPEVAAFETHRHEGLDFWLITQNPTLLDSNVRKLVGCHVHFRVTWAGRYRHEWNEVGDVDSSTSRSLSVTTKYKLPKEAFSAYKSAVLHTKHKTKIPFAVYLLVGALSLGGYTAWSFYHRFQDITNRGNLLDTTSSAPVASQSPTREIPDVKPILTKAEYIEQQTPRIPGLMHTAPIYDGVTQPVEPPEPVGCMDSKKTGCRCYTQQGTRYDTTEAICRQIMASGIYMPWKKTETPVPITPSPLSYLQSPETSAPSIASITAREQTPLTPYVPTGDKPTAGPGATRRYKLALRPS